MAGGAGVRVAGMGVAVGGTSVAVAVAAGAGAPGAGSVLAAAPPQPANNNAAAINTEISDQAGIASDRLRRCQGRIRTPASSRQMWP
jgi:hypothetical protein